MSWKFYTTKSCNVQKKFREREENSYVLLERGAERSEEIFQAQLHAMRKNKQKIHN